MEVTKVFDLRWMMVNDCLRPKLFLLKADFNRRNLLETEGGDDYNGELLHVQKK